MFILAVFGLLTVARADVYLGDTVIYQSSTNVSSLTSGLRVRYIDYDGTILSTQFVTNNGTATPPANPSHDLLTFQSWNLGSTNITQNTDIGATYATTDGKTYAYLSVTTVTTTNCTLYLTKSDGSTLSVAWGDGATSNYTGTGNINTGAHAYPSNGNYVVTLWISSGSGTYGFGNGSSSTTFCGGNTQINRNMLTSCFVGTNVTSLGADAFYYCYALGSITMPNGVTSIGADAFWYAYALASVTIPSSVTSLGSSAFYYCYALRYVTIPVGITSLGASMFQGCGSLDSVAIPSGVTSVGATAFSGCNALGSITIPSGITSLGASAFNGCFSLESVTIPSSVTNIGASAFKTCYRTKSITLPNGVTSIGESAFQNCFAVTFYNMTPTNPPALVNINAFTGINSATRIYVPDANLATYQTTAVWSNSPIPLLYLYPVSQKP
jgi:hypothetical protein